MAVLVRDKMCSHVVTVKPGDLVRKAVKTMSEQDIGCLVICDGDRILGIMTERDVLKKIVASGADPNFTKVEDVMTRRVITMDAQKTVQEAAKILSSKRIKRLPVVEKGKLVGIITMTDLLRALDEIEKQESERLKKTIKDLDLTKINLQTRIIELEDKITSKK